MKDFSKKLLNWHKIHGRTGLPWQNQTDPYLVWLSEIMLQQTQVATVKERYVEFLRIFPTVDKLAMASIDEVMSLWAGLGYYTRARNLHACAKKIIENFGGSFPRDAQTLATLPGIGPSTAAAIAAFCFGERISILDANVKRFLSRVFLFEGDIKNTKEAAQLWKLAQSIVPQDSQKMPNYTQALMDFGATVCTPKKPKCHQCEMATICEAFREGKVDLLPVQTKKKKSKQFRSEMLLIQTKDAVLFEKRPPRGIWGGLWSLPESEWEELSNEKELAVFTTPDSFSKIPEEILENEYSRAKVLAPKKHIFTHRVLYFQIRVIHLHETFESSYEELHWVEKDKITNIGLPTPIRELMNDYFGIIF